MISEEQLQEWERLVQAQKNSGERQQERKCKMNEIEEQQYNLGGVISDLKEQIAQLEKEADWLAEKLYFFLEYCPLDIEEIGFSCKKKTCVSSDRIPKCWREAARKATENK